MMLFIESIVRIVLFTLIIVPMDLKDPLAVIGDYPPAIRKRCEQLGLRMVLYEVTKFKIIEEKRAAYE